MKSGIWQAEKFLNQVLLIPQDAERYVEPFCHGTMSLGMYAPYRQDQQEPHDQDELYFVLSGSGVFISDGEKSEIKTGDAIFVAAGVEHEFEYFTEDFSAWVVFWGAKGGEHEENKFEA